MDDDDLTSQLDAFLSEVLDAGQVPTIPVFLGRDWEPLAEQVADLLTRFGQTMVLEVTRPDGAECYIQFARDDRDIHAEVVSNEFLGTRPLAPDRVSLLVDLGWNLPDSESSPNFSRVFVNPEPRPLAWTALQTLHEVYDAEPDHTWAVIPPSLLDANEEVADDDSVPIVEPWEITVIDEGPHGGASQTAPEEPTEQQIHAAFQLPKAVSILGRFSSVTNSFVNSIIPVVAPTTAEIRQALAVLGMSEKVTCSYCGDPWTEWDHLHPIVIDQKPTGYIHEIQNLVPACGKCNQSKGNKPWHEWMFGNAARSPKTRGIADIDQRAARLHAYETSQVPTKLDLVQIVGAEEWGAYWLRWKNLAVSMRAATQHAGRIRALIASNQAADDSGTRAAGDDGPLTVGDDGPLTVGDYGPQAVGDYGTLPFEDGAAAPPPVKTGWSVRGPKGVTGPLRKNRAVLEAVRALVDSGVAPESLVALLGPSRLRFVEGTLTGDQLWNSFALAHQRTQAQRRLWFLDAPIHSGQRTWVLSNSVWGRQTHSLFRELVTCSGGTVTVTQPNGFDIKRHDTGEGVQVLKAGEPVPPKQTLQPPQAGGWSRPDQQILDRLAAEDPRWSTVEPAHGFGSATLTTAAALAERGFSVRPFDADDLDDEEAAALGGATLLAISGTHHLAVFTNDYGQRDRKRWARIVERIGAYRESPDLDRALADFSIHGPFERGVIRQDGQVWVTVSVRLGDLDLALFDLTNVVMALGGTLRTVSEADSDR